MKIKIELTKDEIRFIERALEEYYNGDSFFCVCEENDNIADDLSRKIREATKSQS